MNTAIEALKKGADDYIPKPFQLDELSTRIKETLDKPPLPTEHEKILAVKVNYNKTILR